MKHAISAVASLLITLVACASGLCCYSGLLVIPIASTVGDGQYSYEYQTDGYVPGLAADTKLLNNEFGFGKRFELGTDVDLNDPSSRVIGNAKFQAYSSANGRIVAALGVSGVADAAKSSPFAIASLAIGKAHLHLGTMCIDGSNRCIAGLDRQFGKLTPMGDYTSGDDGLSSLGFNYQLNDHFALMAGTLFMRGGQDERFTLHLVFCRSLKKGK